MENSYKTGATQITTRQRRISNCKAIYRNEVISNVKHISLAERRINLNLPQANITFPKGNTSHGIAVHHLTQGTVPCALPNGNSGTAFTVNYAKKNNVVIYNIFEETNKYNVQ